ncbi:MAG TPA: hypothetical protein VFM04_01905, partial [Candidatus Methylomirabilis sp.]|nr:hypothetical protein [Candidatus Methylomirabilis sp.]
RPLLALGLRPALQVLAMGALKCLDILEAALAITDSVEFRSLAAAVGGSPGLCHGFVLSEGLARTETAADR